MPTIDHDSLSGFLPDEHQGPMVREVVVRAAAVETELGWSVRAEDLLLTVRGDICTATAQPLGSRMCELAVQFPVRLVIVDLGEVSFADARAISMLVELDRVCAAAGSILAVGRRSTAVARLMHLCGIDAGRSGGGGFDGSDGTLSAGERQ